MLIRRYGIRDLIVGARVYQTVEECHSQGLDVPAWISERLIDYVRVRVSKGGGITQCRKIAVLCEWFGVQTAWQEGGDNDPVNQAAAMHLDMASFSFGIQEENHFRPEELAAFPGHPVLEGGYLYPNDQPGLGIDIDEERADALLQSADLAPRYMAEDRRADGSVVRP